MTTRFVLIRHATCARTADVLLGRALDEPLDGRGEQQAARLAEWLPHALSADLDMIVASPRLRTRQTASAIARCTPHATQQISSDLDEVDFGEWCGQSFEQLQRDARWRAWNEDRGRAVTPAGESVRHVVSRTQRLIHELHDAFPGRTIALITHAEIIRATLLDCLAAPADAHARLEIAPASFSRLAVSGAALRVESVNEQAAVSAPAVRTVAGGLA